MSVIEITGRSQGEIVVSAGKKNGEITVSSGGSERYPPYEGEYTIVPILNDDRTLGTKSKVMTNDLTIKAIPVVKTTNPYGGQTVVIG